MRISEILSDLWNMITDAIVTTIVMMIFYTLFAGWGACWWIGLALASFGLSFNPIVLMIMAGLVPIAAVLYRVLIDDKLNDTFLFWPSSIVWMFLIALHFWPIPGLYFYKDYENYMITKLDTPEKREAFLTPMEEFYTLEAFQYRLLLFRNKLEKVYGEGNVEVTVDEVPTPQQ